MVRRGSLTIRKGGLEWRDITLAQASWRVSGVAAGGAEHEQAGQRDEHPSPPTTDIPISTGNDNPAIRRYDDIGLVVIRTRTFARP